MIQLENTCWWEPDLGIEVKCVREQTVTQGSFKDVYRDTTELQGYSNQKLARKSDTVLRFVGVWNGTLVGAAAGTCRLVFYPDGNVKGQCTAGADVFNIVGQADASGQVNLSMTFNGIAGRITAKVDNLWQISGAWDVPNYGNGTWVVKQ